MLEKFKAVLPGINRRKSRKAQVHIPVVEYEAVPVYCYGEMAEDESPATNTKAKSKKSKKS